MLRSKTNPGFFFEDYHLGQVIVHATPRTVGAGERALYKALYPSRFALGSSAEFAKACGFARQPLDDLLVFHIVFGKTVPDISLNAVANLGYAEGRFLAPVYEGDTLSARSEVIGLKENSSGKTGVVYVRSTGYNQHGEAVLSYCRWVMVRKKDPATPTGMSSVPDLAKALRPEDLPLAAALDFSTYDTAAAGEPHRLGDYAIGELIDHIDGATLEEAEHMMATRLWQNTAKVHFDTMARPDGQRLIYGGHIISMARALSYNGLANAQMILGVNAGSHVNPAFAGDRIAAWSEVLEAAPLSEHLGALRLRLVAYKGEKPEGLRDAEGRYQSAILLDLDYWVALPR